MKLYPVQVIMILSSSLGGIINGLVIGNNLPAEAMTASGLATPFISMINAMAQIISFGSGILCGQYMGRGEAKKINSIFSISINVLVIAAAILSVSTFFFSDQIALLCGASELTLVETSQYIKGTSLGFVPIMIVPCLMTFLQMCDESGISLFGTILQAACNLGFGLINVKLLGGSIFNMGLVNALSPLVVLVVFAIFFVSKKNLVKYEKGKLDRKILKDLVVYGFPAAFASILYAIRNIVINTLTIKYEGDVAANALAIMNSSCVIYDAFNIGLFSALRMLASVFVGERDAESLKSLLRFALVFGVIMGFSKLTILWIFVKPFVKLFGAAGATIDAAAYLWVWYAWAAPLNVVGANFVNFYSSLGKNLFVNIIYLLTALIVPSICCLLDPVFGLEAIWGNYVVSEIVTLLIVFGMAIFKKKKFPVNLDDLMDLGPEFDIEDRMSLSIRNIEDVINSSKDIEAFCKEKGIDERRSKLAGLCLEEMAGNIVEHGFFKDNKQHVIDIFVCVENDGIYLRIRDDCVPFDPMAVEKVFNPEDPCKNVGIRLVSKIAKEMNYQPTFGMNVLSIEL